MVRKLVLDMMAVARSLNGEDTIDLVDWQAGVISSGVYGRNEFCNVLSFMRNSRGAVKRPSKVKSTDYHDNLKFIVLNYFDFRDFIIPTFLSSISGKSKPFIKRFLKDIFGNPNVSLIDIRFGDCFTAADLIQALVSYYRSSAIYLHSRGLDRLYG
jgi:hypothetical protein